MQFRTVRAANAFRESRAGFDRSVSKQKCLARFSPENERWE
jgi:hypothetical protein